MIYLDTSIIIAALTEEKKSTMVYAWLGDTAEPLAISEWSITEVSSALSNKVRDKKLAAERHLHTLALFGSLVVESFAVLDFNGSMFRTASRMADQYGLKLRAGDALHIAICLYHNATLCTLDGVQANAGEHLGIETCLL